MYFCRLYFLLLPPDFGSSHCCQQGRSLTTLAFLTHCLTHDDANGCTADQDEVHVEMMTHHVEMMTRYQTWMQQRASSGAQPKRRTESEHSQPTPRNGTRANTGVGGEMELKKKFTFSPTSSTPGSQGVRIRKRTRKRTRVSATLGNPTWTWACNNGSPVIPTGTTRGGESLPFLPHSFVFQGLFILLFPEG